MNLTLDVEQIKRLLPHRAPFLFVERLYEIRPGESAVGYKAVSYNEPYFQGHFPEFAVMPGVLIVEAMAQTAGALVVHSLGLGSDNRRGLFHDNRQGTLSPAGTPGDFCAFRSRRFASAARCGNLQARPLSMANLCAEAEFGAMIRDNERPDGDDGSSHSASLKRVRSSADGVEIGPFCVVGGRRGSARRRASSLPCRDSRARRRSANAPSCIRMRCSAARRRFATRSAPDMRLRIGS